MQLPENKFKTALKSGELQIGLWSSLGSNGVAEVLAPAGYDWIVLDTEHAPNETPILVSQMQALTNATASIVVRPAWNDPVLIKRILDLGAQTLVIPFVQSADEAKAAVAATRYPPQGVRGSAGITRAAGYGRITDYLHVAAEQIAVIVQVETAQALADIDAIADVEGVDGVFIGPSDLSASMGHLNNPGHEEVEAALQTAVRKLKAKGMPAGILSFNPDVAARYIDWGYNFVAVGSDVSLLRNSADTLVRKFKS